LYSKITAEAQRRRVVFVSYFLFDVSYFILSEKLSIPLVNMNEFCIPKSPQRRKGTGWFLFLISYSMFLILFFLKKLSIPLVNMNEFCIPKSPQRHKGAGWFLFLISYSMFLILFFLKKTFYSVC